MSLLRLESVHREIGTFVILDRVSAALAEGDRVGLVGPNGAGKTTLLRLAAGDDEPDGGRVARKRGLRIGLLRQEANLDASFAGAPTLRAAVRAGAVEVGRLERELAVLEAAGAEAVGSPRYAELRAAFEALDGYRLDQRVDEALSGLGFENADWERPPTALSGGEQTRAALARLLIADPDLLLLDEPTNHLDLAALEWLEATLVRRERALLVASHDRAFLDGVVTRIWELRDRRLQAFRGGYSAYLVQREAADARRRSEADERATAIVRERELVQRYRSHRKYSKMHEHERRLAALQPLDGPRADRRLSLPVEGPLRRGPVRSGDQVVSLRDALVGFPAQGAAPATPIVSVPRLDARRGERIGVVGPNGAGKTTLLRTLAGELPLLDGQLRLGSGVQPGYLAQVRARAFPGATVLDALVQAAPLDPGPARSYLARFLFSGDDVFKPVAELSGGERSRLELAILGIASANLLLLDEPTNHLDIPAREALETFLRESAATVVAVSHDRRLLETVCESLWVVEAGAAGAPGRVVPFDGGYREWRAAVADGWSAADEAARRRAAADLDGRGRVGPRSEAQMASGVSRDAVPTTSPRGGMARLSKDAYRRQKSAVEADLTRLGLRKSHLELALRDPAVQANFVELRRLTSELVDVDAALSQAEDAWLVLEERAPR
ncbi:MAG TPA: ABC-F family ATP-binding cassette domain-containing protein [Candidatus Limnocylindrales bacterium]|nr:ABC-F family ATP-binding cassette domain-containing protein [Candidatus Limnocylindrales bacterium]